MSSERLRARVGPIPQGARASLSGYRHRFNKLGNDGSAKGNLVVAATAVSMGVLYQVSRKQLEILVEIESGYTSAEVTLELAGGRQTGVTFFASLISEIVTPHREYLDHYVTGALEHAIPADYLEGLLPTWYKSEK